MQGALTLVLLAVAGQHIRVGSAWSNTSVAFMILGCKKRSDPEGLVLGSSTTFQQCQIETENLYRPLQIPTIAERTIQIIEPKL